MIGLLEIILIPLAMVVLLMAVVLAVEVVAALFSADMPRDPSDKRERPHVAVLVPAHNEEYGIGATLDNIRLQLGEGDRLLVVADNCTDETIAVARAHGAEVVERVDPLLRGKGYALQFGVNFLKKNPPKIVIVLDADCLVEPGALRDLATGSAFFGRPVQSLYLMDVDLDSPLHVRVSAFAFKFKNFIRFGGLRCLGLPCPLAGTGMAFPWPTISCASLATGDIVEDLKLGIDLAIDGHSALFEPRAKVVSCFPTTGVGRVVQRRRWEHGHVKTIFHEVPRLVSESIRQRRPELLGMGLDLMVPPISLFILILAALGLTSASLFILGAGGVSLTIVSIAAGLTGPTLLAAWYVIGRDLLTACDLIAIPIYIVRKIPMYLGALFNRENQWNRSPRQNEDRSH